MTSLSPADHTLVSKILAFEFDEEGAPLPFTSRLAREQGWTHVFASQVITEYQHFLALAMISGHPVAPSEEVDQAWHLHLLYTRSYWHDLCRDLLGQELHHSPTQGGQSEGQKFHDWYSQTLESYRRLFGKEPPSDIWPAPDDRFAKTGAGRWIDLSQFWILPRPRFLQKLSRR